MMDRILNFLADHPSIVWTGTALLVGGTLVWYNASGDSSDSSRNGSRRGSRSSPGEEEGVPADPYWSRSLFFGGNLRQAISRYGDEGSPLLVVLENNESASQNLRQHIWGNGATQRLLRRHGCGERRRRRRREDAQRNDGSLVAIRVFIGGDDGRFVLEMLSSRRAADAAPVATPKLPLLVMFRDGATRAYTLQSLLQSCDSSSSAKRKAQENVRKLLGRFLGRGKNASVGRAEERSATFSRERQRQHATELLRFRGDWDVAKLVQNGRFDARDVVSDTNRRGRGSHIDVTRSPTVVTPAASAPSNRTTTATSSLRERQDAAFAASLANDRREEERRIAEAEAKELEAALELSRMLAEKEALDRKKRLVPVEPVDDSSPDVVSVVFKVPRGETNRLKRRFLSTNVLGDVFNYLDVEFSKLENPIQHFSVAFPFPVRTLTREASDMAATLSSLGIKGRILLLVRDLDD